uniref:NAD binding site:D-amino acid oxidase n=1 Tax=Paulinella longichromatophora TaxID=1708747 RepID=A0A2H4ZPC9_9EUKA|nr:NAD binding site:D-amino acid oxidase [Paulinella longichromatophora]
MRIKDQVITIIGAGATGLSLAWYLQNSGYSVRLIDPQLKNLAKAESASFAATGILMGSIYKNTRGRSWQLRQRSVALWPQWRALIQSCTKDLIYRPGILFLASNISEQNWQSQILLKSRKADIIKWNRKKLDALDPEISSSILSGLFSLEDGQIDPKRILDSFYEDSLRKGIDIISRRLKRLIYVKDTWQLELECGESLNSRWIVLCTGSDISVLPSKGYHPILTQRIAGQSLQLMLPHPRENPWKCWPGSINWKSNNLVPISNNEYWIGSTIEKDNFIKSDTLNTLINRHGIAPEWLKKSKIIKHWQGLRSRPIYRPSPILQLVAPGLIVATGFYRNGILLAPATAEWVMKCITITDHSY